jgi:Fe-S-cluster-containing hydrogenase component 2
MNSIPPKSNTETGVHMHSKITTPDGGGPILGAAWLRQLCLEAGADDVGFIELERPALADERPHIVKAFPPARSVISFVVRMNRDNVRSPARSIANNEFHHTGDEADGIGRAITAALERQGIRALNPPMGFPVETGRWMTERLWVVAHKPIAVAAGMGRMGIHRNVIHPKFGNFILLGTILLGAEVSEYSRELDYNPCLECKLCVAACPVGAIGVDGHFDFTACYTHNYREFMGGFNDWVENVTDSKDGKDYRRRVREPESISMWQSLAFGPNYKAAYCMAVCPAGEDVISLYQQSKKNFTKNVVKPLQEKIEPLYVIPGSDAEAHARKRYPHKDTAPCPQFDPPAQPQNVVGGHAADIPTSRCGETGGNVSFHLQRQRSDLRNDRDPGREAHALGRTARRAEHPRHRRHRDLAGVSGEGKESAVGTAHAPNRTAWQPEMAAGVWPMLPELKTFTA